MYYLLYITSLFLIFKYSKNLNEILIISLSCNSNELINIDLTINSILNQNVDQNMYKIFLIISINAFQKNNIILPKSIQTLLKLNQIKIKIINTNLNLQKKLIISIKEYPCSPILIINNQLILPEGYLEMIINDHKKYPNDIISASIQYFFGKDLLIKQISEGYKGENFGVFNHISNMIFNFALINTNVGGTLFPANCFKNKYFFNFTLFFKISKDSDEFWQSCFILIENKNIRQSSKIYDYTKNINNNYNYINSKILIYEKIKMSFLKYFPYFKNIIEYRQRKVLISMTSYPERFEFLPIVLKSIKNISPNKIKLVLYEKDLFSFHKNISELDLLVVNKDLKPHKKYYYTMMKYRDYAIITIDDDVIYSQNMLRSLYNYYVDHPNIVAGRRGHLMKFKKNGELENYLNWNFDVKLKEIITNFNIFLTGVGGIIYPPDILNINKESLYIINETLLGDDFTLKYFQIKKGIEQALIYDPHSWALQFLNNTKNRPLYLINLFNNNIYMKNLNIIIENEIIKNLCVNYHNIKTGLIIYLFNINNIKIHNYRMTTFNIDAYSYCPIDYKIKFKILFNKIPSICYFNYSYSIIENNFKFYNTNKILRAFCLIKKRMNNLNKFYFPIANSENNLEIKIHNIHKYIPIIFKNLYSINSKKYILQLLFYKTIQKGYNIKLKINNINLACIVEKEIIYFNNKVPILKNLICNMIKDNVNNKDFYISGLPKGLWKTNTLNDDIPNQFIIKRIYKDSLDNKDYIIIKGQLIDHLKIDMFNVTINFFYPELSLYCFINSTNKYLQAYIFCFNEIKINSEIIIENQIIYTNNYEYSLLVVNSETFLQNYNILNEGKFLNYPKDFLLQISIKEIIILSINIFILLILFIKKSFNIL